MAITKFQVVSLNSGDTTTVDFGTTILHSSVAIQSYEVSFGLDVDHHVKGLNVGTSISSSTSSSVTVSATCYLEDNSSHKATGKVSVLVIAVCNS